MNVFAYVTSVLFRTCPSQIFLDDSFCGQEQYVVHLKCTILQCKLQISGSVGFP
eukprot:m.163249 g.163249  ORF g.163249 m.163249 type:complete len:54 (+) comp18098_c0_seq12:191-352(+)